MSTTSAAPDVCSHLPVSSVLAPDVPQSTSLDANPTIGQPSKITVIFGRKVTKQYRGKLQTEIEDMNLPNPVIRSHYRNGFIKQYVRDHLILRTEAAGNNVTDYRVNKAVEHLPALRDKLSAINNNYLNIQQDILETFVDRGQLQRLTKPTITATGKRIPGLKLDNPRQMALMHALVRFAQIPPANTLSNLSRAVGRVFSPSINENKILVDAPITAYAFSQTGLRKSGPCGAV